ncbi:MAG: T9SS type A sorting domain-containing protein [Bacteroidales bacterium]|nr:T9SS type A sorting domain-containing protein [Bacteroidales bacterium]
MKNIYFFTSAYFKSLAAGILLLAVLIPFSGQSQSITLLAPNGGEAWFAGTYEEVSWSGDNLSSNLRLEFSPDGGDNWYYLADVPSSPNGGIHPVWAPNYISTNALLKIIDFLNPSVSDISDAPFTVSFLPFTIWEPFSGSVVFNSTPTYVSWAVYQTGISLLNAEISTDNGLTYTPLAQNINALTGYTFLVLSETPANACILKLYNAEDPSTFDLSEVFQIRPLPVFTLTSPTEGQIVNANSLLIISWNVQNPYAQSNYIEFSADNGETWEYIAEGTSLGNSGSIEWFTPNVNSDECLIRINDYYSPSNDVSDMFTIMPYPETPVCMVTVDSLTNQNVIIWEKPDSDLIADFLIYKETDEANVYEVIDTISFLELPIVTDFDSNPAIRPYRYKIGFRDSENLVFPAGDYHQTIHLTINQGVNNNWNLIWTPYAGFAYNSYKIMRKSGNGAFEQIASVSASFTSFTDFNAPLGDIAYMVKILNTNGCNTGLRNAVYTDVYSNQASASLVSVGGIGKTGFSVYPVPAKDQLNIQFGDNALGTINLTITDVTGRIIISAEYSDMVAGQVLPINTSDYSEGLYLLNIVTSGERISKKFIIQY